MSIACSSLTDCASNLIVVLPRWPSRSVVLTQVTYNNLCRAQRLLGRDITLVLTRGRESQWRIPKFFRRATRKLGMLLFVLLYPTRRHERLEIFSANGHDTDGNHVDVRVMYMGRLLVLLPLGAFTPVYMIARSETIHCEILDKVWKALRESGFVIHPNRTEALQIHCDLAEENKHLSRNDCHAIVRLSR